MFSSVVEISKYYSSRENVKNTRNWGYNIAM